MLPLSKQDAYRKRYRLLRPGWRTSGEEFEALTRSLLTRHSRVLDLGCGRGGVMELFWQEVKLAVGLDRDHVSLVEHRARLPAVCGLGEALPFPAETFDLVVGLWLLEHLARPEVVLGEVSRVLVSPGGTEPGGHFIFVTPNARHPLISANRFSWAFPAVQRLLIPRLYGRTQADTFRVRYRANTRARLGELAARSNLRVEALSAIPDPTYLAFSGFFFQVSVLLERLLPPGSGVHLLGDFVKMDS